MDRPSDHAERRSVMVRVILLMCALSAADKAWIDHAVEAWQTTSVEG